MPSGKVKYFNEEKGFGFISSDDGGPDVFAHRQECGKVERGSFLKVGDVVTFETAFDEKKGKMAATYVSPWRSPGNEGGDGGGGGRGGGQREQMCRDFLAGKCSRDRCKFSHDERGRDRSRDRRSRSRSPPRYGQQPGYGYPQPGYGYPPPGYGAPPPGYGGPSLPPGWEQIPDPRSGRMYFANRSTGETSWEPPRAAPAPTPPPPPAPSGSSLPPGWEEARDPQSGRPYYFNRATGATQWTPP